MRADRRSQRAMTRARGLAWTSLACVAVGIAGVAVADGVPLAAWVRSGVVKATELAVFATPSERGPRRGAVLGGTRVPMRARVAGEGCGDGRFVEIGERAFVCEQALEPSREPPAATPLPEGGSPHEYLRARSDGVRAFTRLGDVATDDFATALGEGFSVAVAARVEHAGERYVRTRSGLYVAERDLSPVKPSAFRGVALSGERASLDRLAFVVGRDAEVRDVAGRKLPRVLPRLAAVRLASAARGEQLALEDGGLVAARAVRRPLLQARPASVAATERWLDVDLAQQILVAYEGDAPVFATLISSGKPRPGTETPRGTFRIWVKLQSSDMRDRESPAWEQSYALEDVPWVQYFSGSYGLHAVFWHDRFGERQSRGCINLSPADARFLFDFTQPALPPGWLATRPSDQATATAVVVH
jgi:hypothetical protein